MTSAENHEEPEKFIEESKVLLPNAEFDLRGWEDSLHKTEAENLPLLLKKNTPVLGLMRNLKFDTSKIDLQKCFDSTSVTKKTILNAVH